MRSSYNSSNNNNNNQNRNHNHHLHNNNNNFNISNTSDNGVCYIMNGMKVLNAKWNGAQYERPDANATPRAGRSTALFKSPIFQQAANLASQSSQYGNAILRTADECYYNLSPFDTKDQQKHRQPKQFPPRLLIRSYSPPPYSQQRASRHSNNGNYIHRQQQKPLSLPSEHQTLLSPESIQSFSSTDQHYERYYSYFYNGQPHHNRTTHTRRKLPSTLMANAKNKIKIFNEDDECPLDIAESPETTPRKSFPINHKSIRVKTEHHSPTEEYNVLKEKMPNNNIIRSNTFDNGDWIAQLNKDGEFVNFSDNMIDVKEFGLHDTKMKSNEKKLKTRSREQADEDVKAEELNNASESNKADAEPLIRSKGGSNTKKQSPVVHRVLLYDSQSPRLTRPSNAHSGLRDRRRGRSKSPLVPIQNRHLYNHQVIEKGQKERLDCYVRVMKSHNPEQLERAEELKCVNINEKTNQKPYIEDINYNDKDNESSDDDDFDDLDNVSNFDGSDKESTSESEDGYRAFAYKLTHPTDRIATNQSVLSSETSSDSLTNPKSVLVPSLFPNVPPYLAFSSNTSQGPKVPAELYRILKWRVTNVMPKVVRCVLANSGMRLLKKTNDWMGVWGKHMKSPCFKAIRPYQKINHLPGSFKIGRKDACWKNLQKQINRYGKKDFGFMPKTYIIPHDLNLLRKHWPKYAQKNVKWIIKPPASARGAGIRVVDRWAQIPKRRPLIVQKYIERPLLINGSKFDLRLYVLVTSINPLRVFMYHNGLARFASVKYSDRSDTLNDRCMHLTNYSINKFSSNYSKNEDVNACHGHKWTIKSLWNYLANRGVRTAFLWEALRNLVLRTILAGENSLNNMIRINMESKYSCFELFGFDVLLDSDLIPWLLEVNISPSLHSELPLDAHVKAPLVQAVLNTALYNVPPKLSPEAQRDIAQQMSFPQMSICHDKRMYINYLSRAEKIKHNIFTRKTMEDRDDYISAILENLTPDDIRCLIVAEDELARCAPLERIFPTSETFKYLKYTDSPRYYNRLLDAWETRYARNRPLGIALLRSYCEQKYHLEVPPSPAKKQLQYRTRTLIMMSRLRGHSRVAMATKSSRKWRSDRLFIRVPKYKPQQRIPGTETTLSL